MLILEGAYIAPFFCRKVRKIAIETKVYIEIFLV